MIYRILVLTIFVAFSANAFALSAAQYARRPKLIVVLVIDQFRSDYLTRMDSRLLPPGTPAKPGGLRFLTHQGAWFPFAEYDVLQAMTCPGHAMILSGARPALNGIPTNDWFDPETRKLVYCAADADHGLSPRRLRTTTFGDELKNVKPKSRVVAVALKDRSAIMLGGHRADAAIWMDEKTNRWATSTYYNKGELPSWTQEANKALLQEKAADFDPKTVKGSANGVRITLDLAARALKKEKLGRGADPDVLAISLSNHDMLGHLLGPNSPEMEELTSLEDKLIAGFLSTLRTETAGFDDVVIAFTADHGIPPTSEVAKNFKLDSGRFEFLPMFKRINARLDAKFGSGGKKEWILGGRLFHFFLNRDLLSEKKVSAADAQTEVKKALLDEPGVLAAFTRSEYDQGLFPPGLLGRQIRNSYVPGISGDVVLVAKPFFFEKGSSSAVTHMTGWSYDRSVPLILVGRAFKPGVYAGGDVIDIAPTLSFLTGVLPPAMNEGRVLSETFK